jgi:hypothetical protein
VHPCVNVNLGNFSIAVDGGVYADLEGINKAEVGVTTTVSVSMFGKHESIPLNCKIAIGKKMSFCFNILTRAFSGPPGFSCEIGGAKVNTITCPGVEVNLCMNLSIGGLTSKPTGSVTARINAGVQFGNATIAGHSLSLGLKDWNPALFSVKF